MLFPLLTYTKGQIISEMNFGVLNFPKNQPNFCKAFCPKAELPLEGIFFASNFLRWEFLLVKKLEIEKTKTTKYTTFKTDMIKMILVFSISNFFPNKNFQGKKLSAV